MDKELVKHEALTMINLINGEIEYIEKYVDKLKNKIGELQKMIDQL